MMTYWVSSEELADCRNHFTQIIIWRTTDKYISMQTAQMSFNYQKNIDQQFYRVYLCLKASYVSTASFEEKVLRGTC